MSNMFIYCVRFKKSVLLKLLLICFLTGIVTKLVTHEFLKYELLKHGYIDIFIRIFFEIFNQYSQIHDRLI